MRPDACVPLCLHPVYSFKPKLTAELITLIDLQSAQKNSNFKVTSQNALTIDDGGPER